MEDSPLSIAASVTGILTFIAAIFGFIYVRYQILSNGRQEIASIFESVTASILDTSALQQTMLQAESEHDFGSDLKRALISELYKIESEILRLYNDSGVDERMLRLKASSQNDEMARLWQDIGQAVGQAQDGVTPKREGRFSKFKQRWRSMASIWETHSYLFAALRGWSWLLVVTKFVLNLGATPILVRWYMIRKSVLEKVKKRKILRSRLLFYEISNANLVSQKLLKENETLKSDLHEVRTLALQMFNHGHNTQNQSNRSSGSGNNGANGNEPAEAHEHQDELAKAAG